MVRQVALTSSWFAFLALICVPGGRAAEPTPEPTAWNVGAGSTINFREITYHLNGEPLPVYEIVYSLHRMNNPGKYQPSGLWIYNLVEVGQSGHAEICKKWFNQVVHDEGQAHEAPFPFFELDTQAGYAPILTDEGFSVIPDAAVNCLEAMDFAPAL